MMRRTLFFLTATLGATLITATQLPLNMQKGTPSTQSDPSFPQPGSALDMLSGSTDPTIGGGATITLADTLTIDRRAGLWWDYARDITSITSRLSIRGKKETTILVPIDGAIMRLPKKPHQGQDGGDTEESMRANVEKFLSAHIVPGNVELPTTSAVQTLLDGLKVEIVEDKAKEGGWRINPGDIEVLDVKEASNGRILYLNGVIQN